MQVGELESKRRSGQEQSGTDRLTLKRISQRELDQTRRAYRAGNFAKLAVCARRARGRARSKRFHVGDGRIGKVCVIPNVEEIRGETKVLPLRQPEVLD